MPNKIKTFDPVYIMIIIAIIIVIITYFIADDIRQMAYENMNKEGIYIEEDTNIESEK